MTKILVSVVAICLLGVTGATAQDDYLPIQAAEDMQPVISALVEAMDADFSVQFVEADATLLIAAEPVEETLDVVFFLPDTAMLLVEDVPTAHDLMAFAVSPTGQQVLIDAGLMPEVVTLVDQAGETVTIPQPVYRTASPYSIATYLVYGVGAGDSLVAAGYLGARDPQGAAAMERIDPRFPELSSYDLSQSNVNVEEMAELAPNVILTSAQSEWIDPVSNLGIPIIQFAGESPEALKESVLLVGQIYGPNAAYRAQLWVDYYDGIFQAVTDVTADLEENPSVLFTGTQPTRVASGEMYQSAMIEAAGGESVTAALSGYWNDVNLEQVATWNPDVILVPPYGGATVEAITESNEWQLLDAVQAGQVYQVPKLVAPWDTPVMDSVLGIIWMANRLHPDELDLDCSQEVHDFYNTFYDYAISEDEVGALCAP